jgi:ubiquinone/menaquinone biosynthesis C-methylase UbiE
MTASGAAGAGGPSFIPALRFRRLTPLFDVVAAVAVRDRALKRRVLAQAGLKAGEDVLDVGCGTGTLAVAAAQDAPGVRVTGLDADPSILAKARSRAAGSGIAMRFDEGRSVALPYADGSFDVVVSTLFFHHLSDDAKRATAGEILRVLRPGGRLVVGDLGRPHGPLMRLAVLVTQLLDGFAVTKLSVAGGLPGIFAEAGLWGIEVRDRLRTPVGTCEVVTSRA